MSTGFGKNVRIERNPHHHEGSTCEVEDHGKDVGKPAWQGDTVGLFSLFYVCQKSQASSESHEDSDDNQVDSDRETIIEEVIRVIELCLHVQVGSPR